MASAIVVLLCNRSARAELWPTLEQYVKSCVLIVKCETVINNDTVKYRVVETWKGKYSPDLFHHRPPEGYLYTGTSHGNEKPTGGREVIFFFTSGNHPNWTKGKLLDHSTAFVVTDGKVVYASTNRMLRKEYTVEDFNEAILEIVKKQSAPRQKTSTNKGTATGRQQWPQLNEPVAHQCPKSKPS